MPRTGRTIYIDDTTLDPHSETRMATIFLYKSAPVQFFRRWAIGARVERVARHAWEGGRARVCVARWRPSERGWGEDSHRTTIGYNAVWYM